MLVKLTPGGTIKILLLVLCKVVDGYIGAKWHD